MLNLFVSTVVFFVAAWFLHRYLDEQGLPKGTTRNLLVLVLASLMSWGVGWTIDWTQSKFEGPEVTAQPSGDLSQILKAAGQGQP